MSPVAVNASRSFTILERGIRLSRGIPEGLAGRSIRHPPPQEGSQCIIETLKIRIRTSLTRRISSPPSTG